MASVKMKSTCNACALAKVKCNREKPSCSRCNERGLRCHYDPSQRSGRRPAKRPNSPTTFELPESLTDTSNEFQFGNDFLFGPDPSGTSWDSTAPGSNRSSTAATSVKDFMDDYSFDLQQGSSRGEAEDFSNILDASNDAMDVQFPFDQFDTSTHTPPADLDTSPQWLMDANLSSDLQSMINAASKHAPQDVDNYATTRQQTCYMRLLRILPSLETRPAGSNDTTAPLEQPNSHIAMTLSRIIERNSTVLHNVDEMLNCDLLLHDRHCLIVGLIVTKVLAWYVAVMTGKDSCGSSTGAPKASPASWTGVNTNFQHVSKTKGSKTSVSSCHSDIGGNTRMRAQLVLSELRHVLRTLNRWSQRHQETSRSTADAGASNSRGHGSAMCILIEADLRATLQACSREAMKRLHRA